MKSLLVFLSLVALICSVATAFTTPEQADNSVVPVQRQNDLFENSRKVIEQLVETLRKNAQDAIDSINRFSVRVQDQAKTVRDRVVNDFEKLRERVSEVIETVRNKLVDSGASVKDCIESHDTDATALFKETVNKTMSCVNDRISEIGEQMSAMRTLAIEGMTFANKTLIDMRKCTQESDGLLATGSCLGSIAVQAELKAFGFASQSAFAIARMNLAVATLPASLEVCAGSRLVEVGLATSRILMEIGSCSAASVFVVMSGNVEFQTDTF